MLRACSLDNCPVSAALAIAALSAFAFAASKLTVVVSPYREWTPRDAVDYLAVDFAGHVVGAKRQAGVEPVALLVGFDRVITLHIGAGQLDDRALQRLASLILHVTFHGGDLGKYGRVSATSKPAKIVNRRNWASIGWDTPFYNSASEYYIRPTTRN